MFEKIENRDEREWTEDLKMTCANLNGCVVGLVPAVEGWRREG